MVLLHIQLGNLTTTSWLGIVRNMAGPLLLGTSLLDKHIQSIFTKERKLVSNHSRAVYILGGAKDNTAA